VGVQPTKEELLTARDWLLDLGLAYWKSKAFLTACDLDVFRVIHNGPGTAEDVAKNVGLPKRSTSILLNSMVALGILLKRNKKYFVSEDFVPFVVSGSECMRDFFLAINRLFYEPFVKFEEALTHGRPVWSVESDNRHKPVSMKDGQMITNAMHSLNMPVGKSLSNKYDFSVHRNLLDIGGGSGVMAINAVKSHTNLRATVLDRPTICPVTRRFIKEFGLAEIIKVRPIDFIREPIPEGFDVHVYSNIFQNLREDECRLLLKKSYEALSPGGRVLIVEYLLDEIGTGPYFSAMFNLFSVVALEGGGARPFRWYQEALDAGGFSFIGSYPLVNSSTLVVAQKPD
jgi:hypothetical protein